MDARELLARGLIAADDELRTLRDERDAARRLALTLAERLAIVSAHLGRLAERPDRRDAE